MSSPQRLSVLSSSPSSTTLMVPSPNPSSSGRWSPLSAHGLPREPKSPTPTFRSSHVLSPMSMASPTSITGSDMGCTRHASCASYASYASSQLSVQTHHRFDPHSPSPTAYTSPTYTSSITLQPPPPSKKSRLPIIPASPRSIDGLGTVGIETVGEQTSRGTGGFCRRVIKKLCGNEERKERKRMRRDDVVKIESVHWTEA